MNVSTARFTAAKQRLPQNRMLTLAWVLAKSELKQRYFGSVLGALWTLIRPLLLFAVLYVVFNHIMRVGGDIPNYPLYLLMGLSLWGTFIELSTALISSLVAKSSILQKIQMPKIAIPASLVMTNGVQAVANLVILLLFLIGSGVTPEVSWLVLPVAVVLTMMFALGIGLILSIGFVWFRDLGPIWDVFSQLMFWATPIIYVAEFPSKPLRDILGLNPISPMLTELRKLVLDPAAPGATDVFSTWSLIGSGAIFVGVIAIGALLFRRVADNVIEHL